MSFADSLPYLLAFAGETSDASGGPFLPPQVQGFISSALLLIGASFCLLASFGVLRMPDVYTRMQAATKAGTLGVACIILGVASHFGSLATAAESMLIVAFLFLTAPVASHLIARAAYFVGVPKWKGMEVDEMKACYDDETHELHAPARFISHPASAPARQAGHAASTLQKNPNDDSDPQWVEA